MTEPDDQVRIEVTLPAPFETVWRWFRDPELIRRWHGWDDEGLDDEIRVIYTDATIVDEAGRTLATSGHVFSFEERSAEGTTVWVTRAAPVVENEWTAYVDEIEEGWLTFLQQLRFALAHHPDAERRTVFLSGEGPDPRTAPGLDLPGSVWFRSDRQLGLTVEDWGPGLLIVARAPNDQDAQAILTTYDLDAETHAAITEQWTTRWAERYPLSDPAVPR